MDALAPLGSLFGLSFLAGMRLYATVLFLGLGVRFHLLHFPPSLAGLDVLAHPAVLTVAGLGFAAEFVADKIPWFDTLWDSVHTFIRPIGAALVGGSAFIQMDPAVRVALALACGSIALASHSSKAATRIAANHSPEPFSNIALSLAGDVAVPAGIWLAMKHPILTLALVVVALVVFFQLARTILSLFRSVLARLGLGGRPGRRAWN
jgi:hypothetical protein